MKKKLISIFGILAIGSLCYAGNGFAGSPDSIESGHITEADGTSGQDTNSGTGIKTDHIQDGAVTDAKISDVAMAKVTGLTEAIAAIPAGPEGPQGPAGADGVDGATGPQGVAGTDGQNGTNGIDGLNGLSCWDLNGDDIADANEDVNGDGYWDTLDCRGTNGVIYLSPNAITEPFPCDAASDGAVALTSQYTLCVCNSTDWVLTVDGSTSCDWGVPTVTSPTTGLVWMDRNLGASQVATSIDDAAAFGDLYQWGRLADGHQLRTSNTTSILSTGDIPGHSDFILSAGNETAPYDWRETHNDALWQGISGINNPCPVGFRIPTKQEWDDELLQITPKNLQGAFDSFLRLTAAGGRDYIAGGMTGPGGGYSTSSSGGWPVWVAVITDTGNFSANFYQARGAGSSVRCIQD
ncbi:MAG: hypothetical protein ABFS18_09510 [Thermodesulfobacteriota bacterium]